MRYELDTALLSQLREEGYLVLPGILAGELPRLREEADHILELMVNSSLANRRRSGRLNICQLEGGRQIIRRIQPINDLSLYLGQLAESDIILTPAQQLFGCRPVLIEEKIVYKQTLPEPVPGISCETHDDRFAVHSDWAYYKDQGYPKDLVNIAVCLDDCTEDAGPLRVWPGSHRAHLEHEPTPIGRQVLAHLIDHRGGVDVLAPAGSIILFHAMLVHSSRPNLSGRPRRLLFYSYCTSAFAVPFDVRNGPARFRESPYEWNYQRLKQTGAFTDVFRAPAS
jgi:ectoine hydroxylase-related dioxygenase (phytanoyl-CoA dioxygenase family)